MNAVELDRRFWEWSDKDKGDPELILRLGFDSSTHSWPSLLSHKRMVVLAEAGSGKSTEFRRQRQLAVDKGEFAFFATVRETAEGGFKKALGLEETAAFEKWLASTRPAWIFLDSVDEAKIRDLLLENALKDLASCIAGAERRAHIYISGRHSDWEQHSDLALVKRLLTVPTEPEKLRNLTPDDYLLATVRRTRPTQKPVLTEIPTVVVMLGLDERRILRFAQGQGVDNPESFYEALVRRNLLTFARRPLDLEWLADHWRITHGRFGTLAEMLELSIDKRLKERNTARGKLDPNTREDAIKALNRVGAAMVLQRVDTIAIPDEALHMLGSERALNLQDILGDWTQDAVAHFLTKPIFDPAQAGYVRIHNDNQGVVRAFLTARWLYDLLAAHCPRKTVYELLFGKAYGVKTIKPAMRETAAWMSIADVGIAREVIQREPTVLLNHGDPESLSAVVRGKALAAVLEAVMDDDAMGQIDHDALRRFSKPDIACHVIELWEKYKNHAAPRALLLEIIWLGELLTCAAMATEACFADYDDEYTQIFAARALVVTGKAADRDRLARQLSDRATKLQDDVFWDGVRQLFPTHFTVAEINQVLQNKRLRNSHSVNSLRFEGYRLMSRLNTAADCATLLKAQIAIVKSEIEKCDGHPLLGAIEGCATKLLALTPEDEPPALCIEAYLLLVRVSRHTHSDHSDHNTLSTAFQLSPTRRRAAFWAAIDDPLSRSEFMDEPVQSLYLLEHFGIRLGLGPADLTWLLADSIARPAHLELIADTCVSIWMRSGRDSATLTMLQHEGVRHPGLGAIVDNCLNPGAKSEIHAGLQTLRANNLAQRQLEDTEFDRSWSSFAQELRTTPSLLRGGTPLSETTVNHYLFHVWILRHNHQSTHGRSPDGNFSALAHMLGQSVVEEFRAALMEQWRNWKPPLRADRPENLRSSQSYFEAIGLEGIALEAKSSPSWAAKLNLSDAETACTYGCSELDRFPPWFDEFCQNQPNVARKILWHCVSVEWQDSPVSGQSDIMEKIAKAGGGTCALVAPQLMGKLEGDPPALLHVLRPALRIVLRGLQDRIRLKDFLVSCLTTASTNELRAAYLGAVFAVEASLATELLKQTLAKIDSAEQRALMEILLPAIFIGDCSAVALMEGEMPTDALEQLVHLAFETIRVKDDKKYLQGVTYMHGAREDAEAARSAAYTRLVDRPGAATFAAIRRMEATPGFPILSRHLRTRAYERAAYDAQEAPWRPIDVRKFESTHSTVPRTPQDLQRVAISRLERICHDLHHDDFNQGQTVAGMQQEVEVQNWFAGELGRVNTSDNPVERAR